MACLVSLYQGSSCLCFHASFPQDLLILWLGFVHFVLYKKCLVKGQRGLSRNAPGFWPVSSSLSLDIVTYLHCLLAQVAPGAPEHARLQHLHRPALGVSRGRGQRTVAHRRWVDTSCSDLRMLWCPMRPLWIADKKILILCPMIWSSECPVDTQQKIIYPTFVMGRCTLQGFSSRRHLHGLRGRGRGRGAGGWGGERLPRQRGLPRPPLLPLQPLHLLPARLFKSVLSIVGKQKTWI